MSNTEEKTKEEAPKQDNSEIIATLNAIKKQLDDVRSENSMLLQIADKKQLSRFYSRNRGKLPTNMNLREYDGKIVVGWSSVEDKGSFKNQYGAWDEYQTVKIIFEDGTSKELRYSEFELGFKKIKALLVSSTVNNETGSTIVKLRREDNGKEYEIDVCFAN